MKTIEIDIPDDLLVFLGKASKEQENFVLDAIKEKINREKTSDLKSILAEGYQATYKEDLLVMKDFETADFDKV